MRGRDLTFRSAAILVLLTFGAILVHGYHPGVEDDFVYLPAIKHNLNPALYPHDADFFRIQLQATVFDKAVAWSVRLTHLPLDWALLLWQAGGIFLLLFGCWKIARRCFAEGYAQWAGVTLIASLLTMPVAGTALFLVDQHLHPRTLAAGLVLLAITKVLDGRPMLAALWIVAAFLFHPIMAAFGASYCVFLAWPLGGRDRTHNAPILQAGSRSSSLSRKGRYQANSVIPRSEATRNLLLSNEKQVPRLRCAQSRDNTDFTFNSAANRGLPRVMGSAALWFPAFVLALPLGWIFEKPGAAWREAAATRSYYFLGKQEWYEWLGTFAPLVILLLFSKLGRSRSFESTNDDSVDSTSGNLSLMCRRLIWFAVFQFAVTLAIMLPPQLERFRTLQPLRYLHLVYILMLLFAGGLLGHYLLKRKAWRWLVLFLPIAAGMFFAQRDEFSSSAHLEIGRSAERNRWVQAFVWARNNTPVDAYFALGSQYQVLPGEDWHSFRAIAERGQLADAVKDPSVSTQVPRLAPRWQREAHAQDGWANFQVADFERLKRDFGVNWVVLDHEVPGLVCPYSDRGIRVCPIH